jgi:hypothetical protein
MHLAVRWDKTVYLCDICACVWETQLGAAGAALHLSRAMTSDVDWAECAEGW